MKTKFVFNPNQGKIVRVSPKGRIVKPVKKPQ